MEDSLRVRQELERMKKEVAVLNNTKSTLENIIQNLSKEKVKYLEEIPKSKKWAEQQKELTETVSAKTSLAVKALSEANQKLKDVKKLIEAEENKLSALKLENEIELGSLFDLRNKNNNESEDLKKREVAVRDRLNLAGTKEAENEKNALAIIQKMAVLEKNNMNFLKASAVLNARTEELNSAVETHIQNVKVFESNRIIYSNQLEGLKYKLAQANNLISETNELKSNLVRQLKKLDDSIARSEEKQKSLDRNISDLATKEKALQIKDLRIRKLAHEAGLDKELVELEQALK